MQNIIILLLYFVSGTVFADSYPAQYRWNTIYTSQADACTASDPGPFGAPYHYIPRPATNYLCNYVDGSGQHTGDNYNMPINYGLFCPSGGSVSGTECINAPPCESPQVRNANTGQCETPPNCTAGQTKSLTKFEPNGQLTISIGGGPTMTDGGCEYECGSDIQRASYNSAGHYTKYQTCTTTGKTSQQSSGSASSATDATGQDQNTKAKDGCAKGTDSNGIVKEVCLKDPGCGTVNGVAVCTNGSKIMDSAGNELKSGAAKNCVTSGGKTVCASDAANATQTATMKRQDGTSETYRFNEKVLTSTTSTRSAGANGEIVDTTTTSDNVVGSSGSTKTTVTDSSGNSTTTETGQKDSAILGQIAENTAKSDCDKNPDSINCLGTSTSGQSGLGVDSLESINVGSVFSYNSVAGVCPAPQYLNLSFKTVLLSWQPYCDLASGIRPFVIVLSLLSAAYILTSTFRA